LKPLLQDVAGKGVTLVDSAEAMAEQAAAILAELNLANPKRTPPDYHFHVTDVPLRFQTIGERFLGRTLTNVHVEKL
jgi:glutamate racemase